jgi:FMN reductase
MRQPRSDAATACDAADTGTVLELDMAGTYLMSDVCLDGVRIVAVSGSPSDTSNTARLAEYVVSTLRERGATATHMRVTELDATALLRANISETSIASAISAVEGAHGVIIATPVFKAAYSGLLKVFLDLLPQYALAGKAVLPLATGGSPAHVLAIDYGLRPVLSSMGARHIVQGFYAIGSQIEMKGERFVLPPDQDAMLCEAVFHFAYACSGVRLPMSLGHPRPLRTSNESVAEGRLL